MPELVCQELLLSLFLNIAVLVSSCCVGAEGNGSSSCKQNDPHTYTDLVSGIYVTHTHIAQAESELSSRKIIGWCLEGLSSRPASKNLYFIRS
jgi:hypothetical protein